MTKTKKEMEKKLDREYKLTRELDALIGVFQMIKFTSLTEGEQAARIVEEDYAERKQRFIKKWAK